MLVIEEHVVFHKAELSGEADSENNHGGSSMTTMNYIGLDVHKKTIIFRATASVARLLFPFCLSWS